MFGVMAIPGTPIDRAPDSGPAVQVSERDARGSVSNRAIIAAAVLGALSLFVGVLGPVAIVAGLRARRARGSWLALLAVITGSVSTGFLLLGIVHYLFTLLA